MKDYTIIRRRVVTQISTDTIRAESMDEALLTANKDQKAGEFHEGNEWHDLADAIEYPLLNEDDVLEAHEV